jgi:ribonuclease III
MAELTDILGYEFKQLKLLREALSHPSLSYENQQNVVSNQRLEFLGDAVLQLTLSEMLFRLFPKAQEGQLTQLRAQLVSTRSLASMARGMDLGPHILMGRSEELNGGRDRENSLADVFEAILAAIYLDSGLEAASAFVQRVFTPHISLTVQSAASANPKGRLQELIQDKTEELPIYSVADSMGPDHAKVFTASVHWRSVLLGQGIARSKKEAEALAAAQALASPMLKKMIEQAASGLSPAVKP